MANPTWTEPPTTAESAASATSAPISPPTIDAERRQLTVMFCDLVGSTALSTRHDPEDLRELIGDYHRAVSDTVGRFDGFVAKYMGDGVLIYFGYPRAHEDDAERAVRAGLAVIEAVGAVENPSQFGSGNERHDLPHKLIHRFALLGDIGTRQIDVEVPDAQSLVLPQIAGDFVGGAMQKGPWRRRRLRHHDGSRNRNCHLVFGAPGVAQKPPQAGHLVRHFRRSQQRWRTQSYRHPAVANQSDAAQCSQAMPRRSKSADGAAVAAWAETRCRRP
jgi:hypothetical protein